MYLANAYPNSALSAATLTVIALVMAGTLVIWLVMVFLADRPGSGKAAARQADGRLAVVERPERAAQDEHSEAGHASAGSRHGAAA